MMTILCGNLFNQRETITIERDISCGIIVYIIVFTLVLMDLTSLVEKEWRAPWRV